MSDDRDTLRAWLELLGATNLIKKQIDGSLRQRFGLSLSRFDVLAALDRAGPDGLNGGGLSLSLKVTEGNTTQITAPLITDGLISRTTSDEDGRVAIFRLTEAGRTVFDAMAEENRAHIHAAFAQLTPSQVAMLRGMIALLKPNTAAARSRAA